MGVCNKRESNNEMLSLVSNARCEDGNIAINK